MKEKVQLQKYPAYKDSGVEWLGEIPEDWDLMRFKYLFKELNERSSDGSENLLSVSQYTGVTRKNDKLEDGDLLTNASTLEGYKKVQTGDLVTNIMLAWNGSLGFSPYDGITSPAYSIYRLLGDNEERYFHYLLRTDRYKAEFKRNSWGVMESRLRLYSDDFFRIISILPPPQVQTAIASFLDEKCDKIDTAIAQKQKLIELLKERKQIIIQNAVTKGLDSNVKMKDSGVEWIGDIPEHWEVKKLKYISDVVLGKMLCNDDKGNYKYRPYLKSKNIQWLNTDISSVDKMWFSHKELIQYRLKIGDLILSEGGEVGKTCIWNNELNECYIQNSAHKVTFFKNHKPEYFLYQFFSAGKRGLFEKIVNKVSIGHLTRDKLINLLTVAPSYAEQKEITEFIESKSSKINSVIDLQEEHIEKLKEYKSSLIDAVVTGKVKVK